jgi:Gluconate 2-dehydrogenase subunit 3
VDSAADHSNEVAILAILANGIIPADGRDAGAAAVAAGPRLAEKLASGAGAAVYAEGLRTAREISREAFGREPGELGPSEVHDLLGGIRERAPAFFKQLRMDVSALYLSDPGVWRRIGFPGPSIETGGHPDFDRPPEG